MWFKENFEIKKNADILRKKVMKDCHDFWRIWSNF